MKFGQFFLLYDDQSFSTQLISYQGTPPQVDLDRPWLVNPIFSYIGILSARQVRTAIFLPRSFSLWR